MKIKILKQKHQYQCNCVKYARTHALAMPNGLWTLLDKKSIINTHRPAKGRIAIMSCGLPWGHLGVVLGVDGQNIRIKEANYVPCKLTIRTGKISEFKIVGYYDPKKDLQATLNIALTKMIARYKKYWKKSPSKAIIEKMKQIIRKAI